MRATLFTIPWRRNSHRLRCLAGVGTVLVIGLWSTPVRADGLLGSKHDLSVAGPGPIKAATESEVCIFCHTPHRAASETPLWNRTASAANYTPYSSSTAKAVMGQPTGASKLCLSCHDGTVALGMVSSRSSPMQMQSGVTTLPVGPSRLGTDLSDDHPVSITYDNSLVAANGQLRLPSTLTGKVRLDHNNQMQCTSCHDSHDNKYGKFLVQDNTGSALCVTCHNLNFWQASAHRTSTKTWNGSGVDPWPHTEATTVAANACENCHAPHSAGTKPRLLNFVDEERNCFSCHSGTVASRNIQAEFNKSSVHPILNTTGLHDPAEDPVNPSRHVECNDCHNPHATRSSSATVPLASGALAGLTGVNATGGVITPLTKEFELCFRCHADSVARGPARVPRRVSQTNTRLEFTPSAASFHPVVSVGRNANVPSLIAPWTTSSLMYCTDCHNNNQGPGANGAGPKGPHGSIYTPILERRLELTDYQAENVAIYALCYKCHDRNSILGDQSFKGHRRHIVEEQTACTTCHDSHGVAATSHLINFNSTYVTPSSNGRLEFVDTGTFRGNCSLRCHGEDHRAESYP